VQHSRDSSIVTCMYQMKARTTAWAICLRQLQHVLGTMCRASKGTSIGQPCYHMNRASRQDTLDTSCSAALHLQHHLIHLHRCQHKRPHLHQQVAGLAPRTTQAAQQLAHIGQGVDLSCHTLHNRLKQKPACSVKNVLPSWPRAVQRRQRPSRNLSTCKMRSRLATLGHKCGAPS
jgi:hypothetical protein